MTAARIWIVAILVTAVAAGIGVWYGQTRARYVALPSGMVPAATTDGAEVYLEPLTWDGIARDSSPISERTCFTTDPLSDEGWALLADYDGATPLVAPDWFACFDAGAVTAALASGEARAVPSRRGVVPGIDAVLALWRDGRAVGWRQIDPCGSLVEADERPATCPPED